MLFFEVARVALLEKLRPRFGGIEIFRKPVSFGNRLGGIGLEGHFWQLDGNGSVRRLHFACRDDKQVVFVPEGSADTVRIVNAETGETINRITGLESVHGLSGAPGVPRISAAVAEMGPDGKR